MNLNRLLKKAKELRIKTFNAFIEKGEAHLGGSFSMIETLILLYDLMLKKMINLFLAKHTHLFHYVYCYSKKVTIIK